MEGGVHEWEQPGPYLVLWLIKPIELTVVYSRMSEMDASAIKSLMSDIYTTQRKTEDFFSF